MFVPLRYKEEEDADGVGSSSQFYLDMGELENAVTDKTRMIIVNTPHNPTVGRAGLRSSFGPSVQRDARIRSGCSLLYIHKRALHSHSDQGKVFAREELEAIAALSKKHNLVVVSDEVYEWMVYDEVVHTRMASLDGYVSGYISVPHSTPLLHRFILCAPPHSVAECGAA